WGILYATFGSLITALQFNRIDEVMNRGFLSGFFQGSSESTVLGLVSIFYALALGLIPLIARRLISGDVGSSAFSMVRAGAAAAAALISGVSGFAAGASAASGAGAALVAGASGSASATTAVASASAPPPPPSMAQSIRRGIMSAVNGVAPTPPAWRGQRGPPHGRGRCWRFRWRWRRAAPTNGFEHFPTDRPNSDGRVSCRKGYPERNDWERQKQRAEGVSTKGGSYHATVVQRTDLRTDGQQFSTVEPHNLDRISGWQAFRAAV